MSQTDMNVANGSGAVVRADINAHLEAIITNSSGATAPTTTFANMWWADTSANILKRRNNANTAWISVMNIATGLIIGTDVQAYTRDVLSANTNFYVDVTLGSDANDGTAAGAGAWQTLTKAWNHVRDNVDMNGFTVTVNIAAGTYTSGLDADGSLTGQASYADMYFLGDKTTPSNVLISTTSAECITGHDGAKFKIEGCKVTAATSGRGVQSYSDANITIGKIDFGACASAHMQAADGTITIADDCEITGNAPIFAVSEVNGGDIEFGTVTITLTGTPAFSDVFFDVGENSLIALHGVTWSGAATGASYRITNSGALLPLASRASIPGDGTYVDTIHEDATTNAITMASQPAFLAYNSVADTTVTGDATLVQFIHDTEIYDIGSNYNAATGVFTAPVDGVYPFTVKAGYTGLTSLNTGGELHLVTSNETHKLYGNPWSGWRESVTTGNATAQMTIPVWMDAGDTAAVWSSVSGEATKVVNFQGGISETAFGCFLQS